MRPMLRKLFAVGLAIAGLTVSACAGRVLGGGSPASSEMVMLPSIDRDLIAFANVPAHTIGEELPSEGLGTIKSGHWGATLGGFTQQRFSQALGFPPGTKITIRNLSKSITHTLDVVEVIAKPPAHFPTSPKLSIPAHGDGKLETGYASGPIKPGKSVTVTLVKAGTYLIGCAFHYSLGMRDVLVVEKDATPGPQATAPADPTPTPRSRSSWAP
jgi:plastocyanin